MILLTVSPTEAVDLLNGNATSLVRSWKVPLGTAYIAVKKRGELVWNNGTTFIEETGEGTYEQGTNYDVYNGKILGKCEIKKVDVVEMCQVSVDSEAVNVHDTNYILKGNVSDLSHFESVYDAKILEKIGMNFDDFRELGRSTIDKGIPLYVFSVTPISVLDKPMELKDFIVRKEVLNNDKTRIGWLKGTLTRLPSRWQEVEVGE